MKKFSKWQSGKIPPVLAGWYQRRAKAYKAIFVGKDNTLRDGRWDGKQWFFRYPYDGYNELLQSRYQACDDGWEWRGIIEDD